ncbi:MAG: type VI secretion system tube protein Hcp [Myxococcales bacterium]|nr:type VI secretion system tube protein Hcp [Myxococcales bacterium]
MSQISVFLHLETDQGKIDGDSSIATIAGLDVSKDIECLSYEEALSVGYDSRSGTPTGDRTFDPIRVTKWVDRASPVLANAATTSAPCKAELKFFRPVPRGAGLEHFFQVTLEDARVSRIRRFVPEGEQTAPVKEAVEIVFGKITWKHMTASTEHTDNWGERS